MQFQIRLKCSHTTNSKVRNWHYSSIFSPLLRQTNTRLAQSQYMDTRPHTTHGARICVFHICVCVCVCIYIYMGEGRDKGEVHPRTGHEGPEAE